MRAVFAVVLSTFILVGFADATLPDKFEEIYRIKIENVKDGPVAVSEDQGASWTQIGKVLSPTENVKEAGYAASIWAEQSKVSATAVNAIHIKVGRVETSRAIFSILPREFCIPPKNYRSFLSLNSSIQTDIPAGKGIFGGGFSPFVGNPVWVACEGYPPAPFSPDFIPQVGDTFYILVERPKELPREIVFENRFGGKISIEYDSGEKEVIGEVLQPVSGVGRFEGSRYVSPGRIRANHTGVIDISVSPFGSCGGFQIVPSFHAMEMGYVKKTAQYMVIGPASAEGASLEGTAPFYKSFLQPRYLADDIRGDNWEEKLLARYLVQVRYNGEDEWKPMPIFALNENFALPGWANQALDNVSHFKILFPISLNKIGIDTKL